MIFNLQAILDFGIKTDQTPVVKFAVNALARIC